jgi:Holliday junction resolvase RusA-like endonuclease
VSFLEFVVPGDPVAQGRPRMACFGKHPRMYDPPESRRYKELVRMCAERAAKDNGLTDPIEVSCKVGMRFFLRIPTMSKKRRARCIAHDIRPVVKPDWDNLAKSVQDGMIGSVLSDDSVVTCAWIQKFYGEAPRVEVSVWW